MALSLSGILGIGEGLFNLGSSIWNSGYQRQLQNKIFEREDTAVQRRAEDLRQAGLSKTLAAGSAASSGQVVAVDAPKTDVLGRIAQATQIKQTQAQIENINTATANAVKQGAVIDSQVANVQMDTALKKANILLATGNAELAGVRADQAKQWIEESKVNVENKLLQQGYTKEAISKMRAETFNLYAIGNINNAKFNAYSEMLQADLTGKLLDNERQRMENDYMRDTGMKMGSPGTIGTIVGGIGTKVGDGWENLIRNVQERFGK